MRLSTDIWVGALIRRVELAGAFATVARKGDARAGAVLGVWMPRRCLAMVGDLMELARLEAGQETREITTFDAAALLTIICNGNQPNARKRGLFLKMDGPPKLSVEGDAGKVRRLVQNLLLNALKYTASGGVTVNWGEEKETWWLMVKDTGPGMMADPGAPIVVGLKEATASARESDEKTAETAGKTG